METQRIIDIHAHIYPERIATKAVSAIGNFYQLDMAAKKGTVIELKELAQKSNVVKIVVHSVATNTKQVFAINNFVANEAKNESMFIPFATLHPDMTKEELVAEISRFKELGMQGIKLHPDFQEFAIDDKRAYALFEQLSGELPIQIHTGDTRKVFSHPSQMVKAAKAFPHIRFIAAHLGGYSEWADYRLYADTENVYYDCSSSLAFISEKQAAEIITFLGEDKVMFGTDFPMWNYEGELSLLDKIPLTKEAKQKILFDNANKFFNLGL
ncbi:MAG TPA: amidohydrolase family protein [Clostridia bacterium]|nr:amidohydrolase family protein [Clostridia bacterium]